LDRLKERHLPLEKLAAEVSKVEGLNVTADGLGEILGKNPSAGVWLLAAAKMDDDYKKNLLPTDFADWAEISKCFGASFSKLDCTELPNYDSVDLPPFLKHALINILKNRLNDGLTKKT
jgi:hypothetical protein